MYSCVVCDAGFFHLDSSLMILKFFLELLILVVNLVMMRKTIDHETQFLA
jgi:hypothetical protein